jgi:hypothetical protein
MGVLVEGLISFTPQPLFPWKKGPQYLLNGRLGDLEIIVAISRKELWSAWE